MAKTFYSSSYALSIYLAAVICSGTNSKHTHTNTHTPQHTHTHTHTGKVVNIERYTDDTRHLCHRKTIDAHQPSMGTELVRDLEIVQIVHAFEGQQICGKMHKCQQNCGNQSLKIAFVRSDAFLIDVTGGRHVGDAPPSAGNERLVPVRRRSASCCVGHISGIHYYPTAACSGAKNKRGSVQASAG